MIKLFPSTASAFTSNGLGGLTDAIKCLVTEERNGAFELELTYPVDGIHFSDISLRRIIFAKPNPYDSPQAFRIYSISKPINGIVSIGAQHISYDLSGIPVSAFDASTAPTAMEALSSHALVTCPFIFWTDKTNNGTMKVKTPTAIRALLGGSRGSVIDAYGGEYEFDNFTVKLHNQRGENRGVSIRYGKNLTDIVEDSDTGPLYTGVYPFWYNEQNETAASESTTTVSQGFVWSDKRKPATETYVELPEKILNASGTYDFVHVLPLDLSSEFSEAPSESALRSRAQKYMSDNSIGAPKVSIKASFIDLSKVEEYGDYMQLQTVRLCDSVNIIFPKLGISSVAKVSKTVYDVLADSYQEVNLGDTNHSIANTIVEQEKEIDIHPTQTSIERSVDVSTQLITGGLGGFVLLHSSTNSAKPDEILILDTESEGVLSQATKVWRWNKDGLGYSSTGYSGEYGTAINSFGEIIADFIKAGQFDGSLIKGESIEAGAMAQSFRNVITDSANGVRTELAQSFEAANGVLRSSISTTKSDLEAADETLRGRMTTIEQDENAFKATFTDSYKGGINLMANSSGLNGVSDDWEYDGSVIADQGSDDAIRNTISGSLFRISSGYISQNVKVTPGNTYTLTVKARNDTASRCYLSVNDGGNELFLFDRVEISNSWTSYAYTFVATANEVCIGASSAGSYLYVADFMLTNGETKHYWAPAANEVYTTDVKIDRRGINIKNNQSSTETIIDNTQFAVKHAGAPVLSVNKDLTILKKTEIQDDFTAGKLKIINVKNGDLTVGSDIVLLD